MSQQFPPPTVSLVFHINARVLDYRYIYYIFIEYDCQYLLIQIKRKVYVYLPNFKLSSISTSIGLSIK